MTLRNGSDTRRWTIRGQGLGLWPKVIDGPSFEDEENIEVIAVEEVEEILRGASRWFAGDHVNADVVISDVRRRLRALALPGEQS